MNKRRHKHGKEIHEHEHKHNGLKHAHPHFHLPVEHAHPFEAEEYIHKEHLLHEHQHTYSFEKYTYLISFIHALDPRVKFIFTLLFILFVVLTPFLTAAKFALFLGVIFAFLLLSKVPLSFALKRSVVVLPFVVVIALFAPLASSSPISGSYNLVGAKISKGGLAIFLNLVAKAWLATLSVVSLYSTTPFPEFIQGLKKMGFPSLFLSLLTFMYRFIFLFVAEIKRLLVAREARSFGKRGKIFYLKTLGSIIGTLFIRAYERSERVYMAMVSRGFKGELKTLGEIAFSGYDFLFLLLFLPVLIIIFTIRI